MAKVLLLMYCKSQIHTVEAYDFPTLLKVDYYNGCVLYETECT